MNEEILLKIRALVDGATSVDDLARKIDGLRSESAQPMQNPTEPIKDGAEETKYSVDDLATALKAVAGAAVAKDFIDTAAKFESLEKTLRVLYDSSEKAAYEMDYLTRIAMRLGVPIMDVTDEFVKLTAATQGTAIEGQNTKAIFEAVANAMGMLGATSDRTQRAFMAIGQMASKNTVSMEELRLQLGEALPGAMQMAARAMGVTVEQLGEMVGRGEVLAADLLPKLAAEINKTFGDEPPDTTRQALINLENKLRLAYKAFGETGSMDAFKEVLKAVGVTLEAVTITASGAWETVELAGKGIGALAAALAQAATGDFAGAWESLKTHISEATDEAATDINKVAKEVTETGKDIEKTAPDIRKPFDEGKDAAQGLVEKLQALQEEPEKLKAAFDGVQLDTPQAIIDLIDGLVLAKQSAADIGPALQESLSSLDGPELATFGERIRSVFQSGQMEVWDFAALNDQVLGESFRRLGLTAETELGRISPSARDAIAAVDALGPAIAETAGTVEQKSQAMENALRAAFGSADTTAAVDALKARVEKLRQEGALTEQSYKRLGDIAKSAFADAADSKIREAQMLEHLRQLAGAAAAEYFRLRDAGAPQPQQQQALKEWSDAQQNLNQHIKDSADEQESLNEKSEETGSAAEKLAERMAEITREMQRINGSADDAGDSIQEMGEQTEQAGEQTEQAAEAASAAVSGFDEFAAGARRSIAAVNEALDEDIQQALHSATGGADGLRRALADIDGSSMGGVADEAERLRNEAYEAAQAAQAVARVGQNESGFGALDYFRGYLGKLMEIKSQALLTAAANMSAIQALDREAARLSSSARQRVRDLEYDLAAIDASEAERERLDKERRMAALRDEIQRQEIESRRAAAAGDENAAARAREEIQWLQKQLTLEEKLYEAKRKKAAEDDRSQSSEKSGDGSTSGMRPAVTIPVRVVEVRFQNGKKTQVVDGTEDDLLDALETLGARA